MEEQAGGTFHIRPRLGMQRKANPSAAVSLLGDRASTARDGSVSVFGFFFPPVIQVKSQGPQHRGPLPMEN